MAASMIEQLCVVVVCMAGAYLTALGVGALTTPSRAGRFLLGFASTQRLHFAELLARVVVGASFVVAAPQLLLPQVFEVLGWILLGTSALLFFVPWQWHHRFASRTVPVANRYIAIIGVASLVGGLSILVAVVRGIAT